MVVGRVRAPHGLKGEILVQDLTDFPHRFSPDNVLFLQNPGGDPLPVRIEKSRRHKQSWILKLEGIEDRNASEALGNRDLLIPESALQALPDNCYYAFHLMGCEVVDLSEQPLGTVAGVLESGGGALLEVQGPEGEILIPMVEGIVVILDVRSRRIQVNPPPGLVGLNS